MDPTGKPGHILTVHVLVTQRDYVKGVAAVAKALTRGSIKAFEIQRVTSNKTGGQRPVPLTFQGIKRRIKKPKGG